MFGCYKTINQPTENMNLAQALYTAARRYCMTQSQYWYDQATELRQTKSQDRDQTYRQQLLSNYSRSEILMTICIEIERLDVDVLEEIDDTRDRILQAGKEAKKTKPRLNMGQTVKFEFYQVKPKPEIEAKISDERETFCKYIQQLSTSQLQSVSPLPYQRVLSPNESTSLWTQLRQRWQITGNLWYPLCKCTLPDITAFQTNAFEDFCSSVSLINLLAAHNVTRIWELREHGIEYEQDISLFEPVYTGAEGYWSSNTFDWIVYASHEESVTVGGWLLKDIKTHWPDWEKYTW
ncbi:MAG: hypothetical protein F6K11_17280 [Leptolyngbya sp. SIO3F4]|nr:hypothetical protein [Leptolyngbya sp. SIO3F4]